MRTFDYASKAERCTEKAAHATAKQQAREERQRAGGTAVLHVAANKGAAKQDNSRGEDEAGSTSMLNQEHGTTIRYRACGRSAEENDEETHELELDRLMTLHLKRDDALAAFSNPLERLLAIDEFTTTLDEDATPPMMNTIHEFIYGIQREQSELCQKMDALEADIKAIQDTVWKLSTTDLATVARLEKMLGLSQTLCSNLLLEEGAFRDLFETGSANGEIELEKAFAQLHCSVGTLIREYDLLMAQLDRGTSK
jgi:hypothetical protein